MTDARRSHAGTVVVGAGSAGAAIAGLLAANSGGSVALVEAGPDYGARHDGRWPDDLLDAGELPLSHEWGFATELRDGRRLPLERARVIGGCSSHNGCQVVFGHRSDYDGWAHAGNIGWDTETLLPFLSSALERMHVRGYQESDLTPFAGAVLEAFAAAGVPRVIDINDPDEVMGVAPNPANIEGGVRINNAFAYLDPVRQQANLTIHPDTLCDRLLIEGDRVVGVAVIKDGDRERIHADRVVLSAGAFGTPAVLQRSGIGDPAALEAAGVRATHALPGVGENLQDHPAIELRFAGTDELVRRTRAFAAERFHPEEQIVAKLRSSRCTEAFDLQITTQGGARRAEPDGYTWEFMAAVLAARSRGRVMIASENPATLPKVDLGFLNDEGGADAEVLADGLELMRSACAKPPLAGLLGPETLPGAHRRARASVVAAFARASSMRITPEAAA